MNAEANNEQRATSNKSFFNTHYVLLCVLILTLAAGLRFYRLGDKPLHHDESMHVYYSYEFMKYLSPWHEGGSGYKYDPMMHGPFLYHTTALCFFICGDSDAAGRYPQALFGVLLVGLLLLWRPFLGAAAALLAAFILATAPVSLYMSRYARMDMLAAFFNLGMLTAVLYYLRAYRPVYLYLFFACASLAYCTKEISFITFFIFFTYLVLRWCVSYVANRLDTWDGHLVALRRGELWFNGLAIALILYLFFYSSVFTHARGALEGFYKGLAYWMGQHGVQRGDQPLFYYLGLLVANEFSVSILALGAFASRSTLRAFKGLLVGASLGWRGEVRLFLLYWTVLALVIYSLAGEKMPWLGLHIITPAYILSALVIQELWGYVRGKRVLTAVFVTLLLPFFLLHLKTSIGLSFMRAADPAESMVYTQSTPDCPIVSDLIREVAERIGSGCQTELAIEDTCSWPFSWYLRDFPRSHPPVLEKGIDAPIVLTAVDATLVRGQSRTERNREILEQRYYGYRYQLRAWWLPRRRVSTPALFRYLVQRKVWNPAGFGSYDFMFWIRKDVAAKVFAAPFPFEQARRYR